MGIAMETKMAPRYTNLFMAHGMPQLIEKTFSAHYVGWHGHLPFEYWLAPQEPADISAIYGQLKTNMNQH